MTPKKVHRFLVEHIPQTEHFTLAEPRLIHQTLQVLKMTVGEQLALFVDGGSDIICTIIERTRDTLTLQKNTVTDPLPKERTVIAGIAIAKGQTFELIVQKLTELGVATIVPIITDRTVKQSVRIDRIQTISDEALEQSGGNARVTIHEPMTLAQCLKQLSFPSVAFQAGVERKSLPTEDVVVMYIGPEGGWSNNDIDMLDQHEVQWQSLGNHILRTETAAIVGAYTLLQ